MIIGGNGEQPKKQKYFYEQFLGETRRMTIDSGRN